MSIDSWGRSVVARLVVACAVPITSLAAQQGRSVLRLKSRALEATAATTEDFIRRTRQSSPGIHGYAIVGGAPSTADRAALAARGVTLGSRLTRTAYVVRARRDAEFTDTAVTTRIRFFAASEPSDRVAPALWTGRFEAYAHRPTGSANAVVNRDSTVNVIIRFHSDVGRQSEAAIAAGLRAARRLGPALWTTVLGREAIRSLAANDAVRWIDVVPVRGASDIDKTRAALHVDAVQGFDFSTNQATGLTGKDIRVAHFDDGIDAANSDLQNPVTSTPRVVTTRPPGSHGTYTAGIIAGDGSASAKYDTWGQFNGGSPYQWRGMAPGAWLIDAAQLIAVDAARGAELRNLATTTALSNHSYWLTLNGEYGELSRVHDAMIRGDDAGDGLPLAPRLHVHSAGNFGLSPLVGDQRGFFSLGNQLKNALSVGNYNLDANRPALTSSLGPTHDGRIKPDVVAPGTYLKSVGWCAVDANPEHNPTYYAFPGAESRKPCDGKPPTASYPRRNFYFAQAGTSGSAAAVTGVLTLVAEQLKTSGNAFVDMSSPLPSTLRAIAIHSAMDLQQSTPYFDVNSGAGTLPVQAFSGPDFVTGFGLVDAAGAVDVVNKRLAREGVVAATCETKTLKFTMQDATAGIKITLAWDDPATDAPEVAYDEPLLVNDLDLVVIDPGGTKHYPWLLDQQVVAADGTRIADDAQACGTPVIVKRALHATTDPFYAGVDANLNDLPGSRDDPISPSDLQPAGTGKDHLNNVEQVVAAGAVGEWTVEVSGFAVDVGPQRYSLIGVPYPKFSVLRPNRTDICARATWFCEWRLQLLCAMHPQLCENADPIYVRGDTINAVFRNVRDVKVLELGPLCSALAATNACDPRDLRADASLSVLLRANARSVSVELFDAAGRLVARDTSASESKELRIRSGAGPVFLVIRRRAGATRASDFTIPISVRRR